MRSTLGRGGCFAAAAGADWAAGAGAFAAGGGDWPHPAITSIPMSTAQVPAQRAPPVPIMSLVLPWFGVGRRTAYRRKAAAKKSLRSNACGRARPLLGLEAAPGVVAADRLLLWKP